MKKTTFLILIGLTSLNYADFSRNSSGVVSDSVTHLEWQDSYVDNGNEIKKTVWEKAIDYCDTLSLDGKSDWRLPNINELNSLVDYSKTSSIINLIFQNTNSNFYWSSTSDSYNNGNAWIVYFDSVFQYYHSKGDSYYVRCVRAGE